MAKTVSKLRVVPASRPSPLVQLVEDCLADMKARGLSPKTIKNSVGWPLREIFLPWAADNGISSVGQLDNRTCNQFSAYLHEHGGKKGALATASIWTYSKAVRRFLEWAKAEGEKVAGEVKLPKLDELERDVLTTKEMGQLEDAAVSERDKLIIRVLADGGMRREELAKVTTKDLYEESGKNYLVIHGKGGGAVARRDRKVPVSPRVARRLRRYIAGRPHDADSPQLFLGLRRRPDGSIQPLTPSGITQMVAALGERTLDKQIGPHTLRHSFITEMRRKRVDPILVAQIVGHRSLRMIQKVYDHMTPADAHDELMRALRADE
jgi:integrase/recombinase XerD